MSKVNVQMRSFKAIKLSRPREEIKAEACISSVYDQKAAKKKVKDEIEAQRKSTKANMRVYGYKHPKVIKFLALICKCLKNCAEQKPEMLNLDMNNFLLLKNELSLAFLRNQDNIVATLKSAIRIYATMEENVKKDIETSEMAMLEKILKSAQDKANKEAAPDQQDGVGGYGNVVEPGTYEKIIAKLLEYNEKMNEGKEISVVEYLKRLDLTSDFAKQFEMQRHIRRAFYEEFKIHSLNYVLLLFESVMRILTTV